MKDKRIGFIGLGIMGMPMTRNLLKAGFQVVAHSRTQAAVDQMAQEGASPAASSKEVAQQCDVVIIMVPDTPDVEQVILGDSGVIHGVRPDSVVIDMSTISPSATRGIAERLREKGAHMLDAPVSGGQWGAIDGTLSIMVGGEQDIFDRCLPVFQAMGQRATLMGSNGAGQITKLVNQILVVGNCSAVAEALVFAAAHGADLEKTIAAVSGGAAASWQLTTQGPRIIKGDFAPGFMVKLQQKDLRLILEAAREHRVPLPLTSLAHQLYTAIEAEGLAEESTAAIVKAIEKLAGVQARTAAKA